jgi:hypothetical protein
MLASLFSWLGGKLGGVCALLFALGLAWQTARIDGVPLLGGGLKAKVAALTAAITARDLKDAQAEAALLRARQQWIAQGEGQARAHAAQQAKTETQIRTVIEKVPVYVSQKAAAGCVIPWGAVRLLDAAASGADPAELRARIAPGQSDDAASDVALPEALALLAADLGIARENAGQLERLEKAVGPAGADE